MLPRGAAPILAAKGISFCQHNSSGALNPQRSTKNETLRFHDSSHCTSPGSGSVVERWYGHTVRASRRRVRVAHSTLQMISYQPP